MTVPQMVVRCPVCLNIGPARTLAVDFRGAEVTCGECGAATRFPPYSRSGSEQLESGVAADAPGDAEREAAAIEAEALAKEVLAPAESVQAEPVEEIGSDDPRLLLVYEIEGLSEDLIERYRKAVRQGDDVAAHGAVVSGAVGTGNLHLVGSLYRRRGERIPGDAVAEAMRKKVMSLAMTLLQPTDAETAQKKFRSAGMVGAVLLLIIGLSMLAYVIMFHSS